MSRVTLGTAARQTGLSKSTLSRAIRDGKRASRQAAIGPEHPDPAVLQAQIDGLRQVLSLVQAQLHDTQKQRDAWQNQAERLALSKPAGSATEAEPATRLTTEPVLQPATAPAPLINPFVPIWRWVVDMVGRATAAARTAPALEPVAFDRNRWLAATIGRAQVAATTAPGEPVVFDRSRVPAGAADLNRLERDLGLRDATPSENSPPVNSVGHGDTPRTRTIAAGFGGPQ
jgi:hypothetical protein